MTGRAGRSLKASPEGIDQANNAVLMFATKLDLAAELEISRTTVQRFFAGKSIERENFHKICQKLQLPWQEIAGIPKDPQVELKKDSDSTDIDTLVQTVRKQGRASLRQRCGILRVLDMPQPIRLLDVYTSINVLKKISGQRWLEIEDLNKCDPNQLERLGRVTQKQVSGVGVIQRYSKLLIRGKPGMGKTTFLKYVALQCNLGTLHPQLVPLFILLRDFAQTQEQPSLFQYICQQLATYGVTNPEAVTEQLLSQGKMLLLLDGLDEVPETDNSRVLREIRQFVTRYYDNHCVITCRLAAQDYTFEQFTEVEIANFNQMQISVFATRWFADKDPALGQKFIQKLRATPPIQELANYPILLTLLCLVFEESASFPANRSELYQEGLDILLKKWDAKRDIDRAQVYQQLSIQHKRNLLSQIAQITFEQGDYFFKQQELEEYIRAYLENFSWASTEPEALHLDSKAVLNSIESQHGLLVERARGIYSFSHLTFQEYFTAQAIVTSENPQALQIGLKHLAGRVTETRWREVFLLSVNMLRNADYLLQLMKQQIDQLVAQDSEIQALLTWVNQKAETVIAPYKGVVIRAFYLDLALAQALVPVDGTLALARSLNPTLTRMLARPLALDLALDRALSVNRVLEQVPDPHRVIDRVLERALSHASRLDLRLERSLQQLKDQLPDVNQATEFNEWWQARGQAWTEQLQAVVIKYRNLGHCWQWSPQQQDVMWHYYTANQLLIECLTSSFYVTRAVRSEIEATLLLPTAEFSHVTELQQA